jgi:predicted nucleotidyltransferase
MALPSTSYDVIKSNIEAGKGPILLDAYSDMLLYRLRTMTVEQIGEYMSINEGLEYRIKKAAAKSTCIDELIDAIKTKRYTRAFIQRLLCHVLIDVKWAESYSFKQAGTPSYCRVLGFNDKGKQLLKKINDTSEYPVINKVAAFKSEDPTLNKIFKYDLMSTDIYNLAYTNKSYKRAGEDYIKSPVYI